MPLNRDTDENLTTAQRASKERDRKRAELQAKAKADAAAKRAAKKSQPVGEAPAKVKKVATKAMRKVAPKTKKPVAKPVRAKSGVHQKEAITPIISAQLQQAYDFFNKELWAGELPQVVLLFARKPRSYGYFWPKRWGKNEEGEVHELALNPDHMRNERDTKKVLSTLVHEQCHVWQFVFGEKCPTRPYHNKEFSAEMERVGLITSSTGQVGGKRTGTKMTHYIDKLGRFDQAADKLIKSGFNFDWSSFPVENTGSATAGKRVKYVCSGCDAAAWGKAELHIECSDCEEKMEAQ